MCDSFIQSLVDDDFDFEDDPFAALDLDELIAEIEAVQAHYRAVGDASDGAEYEI